MSSGRAGIYPPVLSLPVIKIVPNEVYGTVSVVTVEVIGMLVGVDVYVGLDVKSNVFKLAGSGVSVCGSEAIVGSAAGVLTTMDVAVSERSVGLVVDGAEKLLHDVKIIARNKGSVDMPMFFNFPTFLC